MMKHPTRKKGDARRQRQRLLLLHFNFSVWRSEKLRPFETALGWAEIYYKRAKDPDARTLAHQRLNQALTAALVARAKYNLGLYVEEELKGCRS